MAAINWIDLRGQKFTPEEAREASDFHEIVINFNLNPQLVFDLFAKESLSVAKRMVIAEIVPLECALIILPNEHDLRIRAVIQNRIQEGKPI